MGKRKAAQPLTDDDVATYEIERIEGHSVVGVGSTCYLEYDIKWKGYPPEENSSEAECRIISFLPVIKYWMPLLDTENCLTKDLAAAAMLLNSLQSSYGRFISTADISIKHKLLSVIDKYKWDYRLVITPMEHREKMDFYALYTYQLRVLYECIENYPLFEVYNDVDDVLPIPLSRVLFKNIKNEKESHSIEDVEDCPRGWLLHEGGINIITEECGSSNDLEGKAYAADRYEAKLAVFEKPHPVAHVTIIRTRDQTWELQTRQYIKAGQRIMPIYGELVDKNVAGECFMECPLIAFSGFINFDAEYALDRRKRSDFSQYLFQSCSPNCKIRKEYVNGSPVLYVIAKRDIRANEKLSVDWFANVSKIKYDFSLHCQLVEAKIDHILCSCLEDNCRNVLWKSVNRSKGYKVRFEREAKNYGGLSLC